MSSPATPHWSAAACAAPASSPSTRHCSAVRLLYSDPTYSSTGTVTYRLTATAAPTAAHHGMPRSAATPIWQVWTAGPNAVHDVPPFGWPCAGSRQKQPHSRHDMQPIATAVTKADAALVEQLEEDALHAAAGAEAAGGGGGALERSLSSNFLGGRWLGGRFAARARAASIRDALCVAPTRRGWYGRRGAARGRCRRERGGQLGCPALFLSSEQGHVQVVTELSLRTPM